MSTPTEDPRIVIDLFADSVSASEAIAVMHRAFDEYTAKGQQSGALRETAETLRAEMTHGLRLGVVRVGGRMAAVVKHTRAQDRTLYFGRLGVAPEARGSGLAGMLVRALRGQAEAEGLDGLSCAVRADEAGNIALYEHLGMEIVSREQRMSRTGALLSVVVMKDLVSRASAR